MGQDGAERQGLQALHLAAGDGEQVRDLDEEEPQRDDGDQGARREYQDGADCGKDADCRSDRPSHNSSMSRRWQREYDGPGADALRAGWPSGSNIRSVWLGRGGGLGQW